MALTKVTYAMIKDAFANVVDYGADSTGVADSASAIQAALDTGKSIYLPEGTYKVSSRLTASTPNITICGPGIIKPSSTWSGVGTTLSVLTIALAASNVTVNGITIDSDDTVIGSQINFQVESFAPNTIITNCRFINSKLVGGASASCVALRTTSDYSQVINNYFNNTQGAVFVQGANCIVSNNICIDPNDGCIVLNGIGCTQAVVSNNVLNNNSLNSLSGLISVEEGANEWVINGNNLYGLNDGHGIGALNVAVFTDVRGGIICNNNIVGGSGSTTNPATGIYFSDHYTNVQVYGNTISGIPTGNSASAALLVYSTSSKIFDNYIDGTGSTGLGGLCLIAPATSYLILENNHTICANNVRHYLFVAGDFTSNTVSFIGGKLYGGSEGINTNLNTPTNLNIWIENISESTATNFVNIAASSFGNRQTYFNTYSAQKYPHSIKQNTVMYGNAVPTTGTWAVGDTVANIAPSVGQPKSWLCTVAGTPGTWVSTGNL